MNQDLQLAIIRVLPFLVILFILRIATKKKKIDVADFHLKRPDSNKNFLFWIVAFFVFILLVECSLYKLGILEIDKWKHSFFPSIIRICGAVVLAPLAEELIFRGLILTKLIRKDVNVHLAILIQSCFFVLLHSFTYQNSLSSNIGIAQSYVDASLFAYARLHTKSIYTPIAMHVTGNMIATVERFIL